MAIKKHQNQNETQTILIEIKTYIKKKTESLKDFLKQHVQEFACKPHLVSFPHVIKGMAIENMPQFNLAYDYVKC